jgi:hypothetical protein
MVPLSYQTPTSRSLSRPARFFITAAVVATVHLVCSFILGVVLLDYTDVLPATPQIPLGLRLIHAPLSFPASLFESDSYDDGGIGLLPNAVIVGCFIAGMCSFGKSTMGVPPMAGNSN